MNVIKVTIALQNPLHFLPGQYVIMVFASRIPRNYSIANLTSPARHLELLVDTQHTGVGVRTWQEAKPGTPVVFDGPAGDFRYVPSPTKESWFIGVSSGLAPLFPLRHQALGDGEKTRLFFGGRTRSTLYKIDGEVTYALTRPNVGWQGATGRLGAVVMAELNTQPRWEGRHFYVCGNPSFAEDTAVQLWKYGVPERHIFYEKFGL